MPCVRDWTAISSGLLDGYRWVALHGWQGPFHIRIAAVHHSFSKLHAQAPCMSTHLVQYAEADCPRGIDVGVEEASWKLALQSTQIAAQWGAAEAVQPYKENSICHCTTCNRR